MNRINDFLNKYFEPTGGEFKDTPPQNITAQKVRNFAKDIAKLLLTDENDTIGFSNPMEFGYYDNLNRFTGIRIIYEPLDDFVYIYFYKRNQAFFGITDEEGNYFADFHTFLSTQKYFIELSSEVLPVKQIVKYAYNNSTNNTIFLTVDAAQKNIVVLDKNRLNDYLQNVDTNLYLYCPTFDSLPASELWKSAGYQFEIYFNPDFSGTITFACRDQFNTPISFSSGRPYCLYVSLIQESGTTSIPKVYARLELLEIPQEN